MNSTLKSLVFWVVLVLVGGLVWNFSTRFQTAQKPETFSEFMSKVDAGQVARVTITGNEITYTAKNGEGFRTYAPAQYEGLANKLLERNVAVAAREPTTSPWAALLYSWAPILLMIGFWVFFMRQMQSGGNKALSFGKSKAKLSSTSQKKVTFKDVAGVDEAKEELQEIIEFLREPQNLERLLTSPCHLPALAQTVFEHERGGRASAGAGGNHTPDIGTSGASSAPLRRRTVMLMQATAYESLTWL